MLISELTMVVRSNALYEQLAPHNHTGFLTEDLVKIIMIEQDQAWCKPQTYEELMMEMGLPVSTTTQPQRSPVVFIRAKGYRDQYLKKIYPHQSLQNSLKKFMDMKRQDPKTIVGNDKLFRSSGNFSTKVPGIAHAHLAGGNYSVIYKVDGNRVYLYGFYTHDELGTGTPEHNNRQKTMATQFAQTQWTEPIPPAPGGIKGQQPKWTNPE